MTQIADPPTPSAHLDTFARDHLPAPESWPTFEFTVPEVQYPTQLNAATELITRPANDFGADRPALHAPGRPSWSYGDLLRRANQVAQLLVEDFDVVPGNRVMLRAPNNQWLVACWLGALKAGAVVATTVPALRDREVQELIDLTTPSVLLCDHRFTDDLPQSARTGETPPITVLFGGERSDDLTVRCAAKSGQFVDVPTAADDVALLGPTSGSTGTSKITMHFHRDVLANADTFARYLLKPVPDDVRRLAPAGLHLRARRVGGVPAAVRRVQSAYREDDARGAGRAQSCRRRHRAVHRAHRLPGHRQAGQGGPPPHPAVRGVGRRAPTGGYLAAGVRRHRPSADRRHRLHRDAARIRLRRGR